VHSSLRLQANLITIGACVAVAAGTATLPGPFPGAAWALALAAGIAVGVLRARSMAVAPQAFVSARTSADVQAAFMSTGSGQAAVLAQWVALLAVLGVAWWGSNVVAGALGGLAVFTAARDGTALKAVLGLASATDSAGH
jgi:hypothetical protein